jgi:uncharacterized protein
MLGTASGELTLIDWKRRVFELYAQVRAQDEPEVAWEIWRGVRDELFATHPQTPLPEGARESFTGLSYEPYDPALRVVAEIEPADGATVEVGTSTGEPYLFRRFAAASFELDREQIRLPLYWLAGYGGGIFLPFGDTTNGVSTYGAGRYLLDTVKGSDLGESDGGLVLDFNFAYNPSCAYEPTWTCPLPPPENRLEIDIVAGERTPA